MARFDNVLLVSDFDGTLNDDNGRTPPDVIDAIRYFESNGGRFAAGTGRTFQGLGTYAHSALFNAPSLLANGALAYDFNAEEIAFFYGIGEEGVALVRDLSRRFPNVSIEMYPFNETYAIHMSPGTQRHFTDQGLAYIQIDDPSEAPRPWQKVMLCCPDGMSAQVQTYLAAQSAVSYLPTDGSFVEVLARRVNKGTGLLRLADLLGIAHTRVYAAGDGYNDVDMLRAAAGAFVPCNGSKEALAAATHVVRSNNEGAIAHAIEILDSIYGGNSDG